MSALPSIEYRGDADVSMDRTLTVAGVEYRFRLLVGTGKYRDFEETRAAIEASGAEIVTVAIRRTNIGRDPGEPNLLDHLPPDRFTILPSTAGCYDAKSAVRTCRLARELLDGHRLVKLEVLGDEMNTAIAAVKDPILMASAMRKAVEAGREEFLAGRMPRKRYASASCPIDGTFV